MTLEKKDQGVLGIHHVTAIARDPQKNFDFYSGVLGLRLVKLTVNFDDPTTYHLYYGDEIGRPGTILTFFPWVNMHQGWRGTGEVDTTSFLIPENAIEYWTDRFKEKGVEYSEPIKRFDNNEQIITFYDTDGLKLELVANKEAENRKINYWKNGPIPVDYALRGFYSITLSLDGYEETASLLTNEMGFSKVAHEGNRFRFQIKARSNDVSINDQDGNEDQKSIQSTTSIVDLVCLPYTQPGTMGAGTVHHVAWRTPTDESQIEMRKKIIRTRLNATPVIDRLYFHSVYFREPGGVLFEIATDLPGFMIDQKPEELGQKLVLPKWLEPKREYIEKTLPSIKISNFDQTNQRVDTSSISSKIKENKVIKMNDVNLNFIHRFISSPKSFKKEKKYANDKNESSSAYPTLLLLHGTGGNEDDLIPLGRMLYPNANLLSPRGKVLEQGMPRFFRRLAEGVFDIEDLKFRTHELAKFIYDASLQYSFDLSKTIAVGFSNGANIATSLLLLAPQVIAGTVLVRPMVPFIPNPLPDLSEKKIIILAGQYDPIVSKKQAEDLFSLLKSTGAKVSIQWQSSGHEITQNDVHIAKKWLSENF